MQRGVPLFGFLLLLFLKELYAVLGYVSLLEVANTCRGHYVPGKRATF